MSEHWIKKPLRVAGDVAKRSILSCAAWIGELLAAPTQRVPVAEEREEACRWLGNGLTLLIGIGALTVFMSLILALYALAGVVVAGAGWQVVWMILAPFVYAGCWYRSLKICRRLADGDLALNRVDGAALGLLGLATSVFGLYGIAVHLGATFGELFIYPDLLLHLLPVVSQAVGVWGLVIANYAWRHPREEAPTP